MVLKKDMYNSSELSRNISMLQNKFAGKRALVVDGYYESLIEIPVKDFYHIIIAQSEDALASVSIPDFLIYGSETPYKEDRLHLPSYFGDRNTIFVTNYLAIKTFKKLKRRIEMYNLNYVPSDTPVNSSPADVSGIKLGLNKEHTGVHLAFLLGCDEIHYTGQCEGAQTMTVENIFLFTQEKSKYTPKHFVGINRNTVLVDYF